MKYSSLAIIFSISISLAFIGGGRFRNDKTQIIDKGTQRQILYYIDPMTPGFRSDKPGTAPCGMPLEPVYADASGEELESLLTGSLPPGSVQVNAVRRQLIGVVTQPVEAQAMTYTLRLYGQIVPDENRIFPLNASTDTWVRNISDVTTGSLVKKDKLLAEVLDPDFYDAQVAYLVALTNFERYKQKLGPEANKLIRKVDLADNQMRVAIQDLLDFGITDAQVEELSQTRKAESLLQIRSPVDGVVLDRNLALNELIKAGEPFYTIADIGNVWVYADVYENEIGQLKPGMAAMVKNARLGREFPAKISRVLPLFDSGAGTLKVRLDVDNPDYELRPDMFVDVEIPVTMAPSIHVPADAIVDSGTVQVVYVDIGDATYEPRQVRTGWRLGREVEIVEGLMPGEKIVVSGNFLIDSESRMKTAAAGLAGETSKDPVCGMSVVEQNAERLGNTAEYEGKTFYFCMPKCRDAFGKEPEKYMQAAGITAHAEHLAATEKQSWLDMLAHGEDPAPAMPHGDNEGMMPQMHMHDNTPDNMQGADD